MRRPLVAIAAAAVVVLAGSPAHAGPGRDDPPGHRDANHCTNVFGVDLNALYGVSDQFRNARCMVVSAGEHWTIGPLVWIVNFGADSVYPPGYEPAEPEPIDDFASKLVAVKVVVDGRTHVFPLGEALRTDIDVQQLEPGAGWPDDFPMASLLPRLPPLSVGQHTFQPFIVLSAEHCDGFAPNRDENCLPAGEFPFGPPRPVTVTTP